QRQVRFSESDLERAAHRLKLRFQDAANFLAQRFTVLASQLHRAARIRIAVACQAQHKERLRSRMVLLDVRLCKTGVVATDFVAGVSKRGVMRAGAEQHGSELAIDAINPQNGNAAIRQAAWIDAEDDAARSELPPVHDEVDH